MKIRKAIKKIVALAAGTTMLGTTLLGAMAADLGDYPSPFVKNGVADGLIVVGKAAAAEDIIGAIDIAASLQAEAYTLTDVSCSGGITVSGGETQEIPLGANVTKVGSTSLMDSTLTDDDLSGLQDTSIDLNGSNYDVHDEVRLTGDVKVVTSLSAPDDNYEGDVYLEVQAAGGLKYCYVWDETVNLNTHTSADTVLSINFLGQKLEVYDIVSATSIQAIAGTEIFMDAGDTLEVAGKTVSFVKAGASSAVIDVDGEQDVVSSGTTKTLNGIKVRVKDVFNEDGTEFDSAVLIVGTDALETYKTADPYFGEDKNNPDWIWEFAGLQTAGSGATQTFCVRNKKVINDLSDDPSTVGEYMSFPNDFIQVGIESLTVADDSYSTYKVYYESSTDLTNVGGGGASEKTFVIESLDYSEGLKILATPATGAWVGTGGNLTADIKTDKVFLHVNTYANGLVDIFYEDANNKIADAGTIRLNATTSDVSVLEINYKDTKGTDMPIDLRGGLNLSTDNVTLVFDTGVTNLNDGTDDIAILLGDDGSADFDALGNTLSTDEDVEVVYGTGATAIKIGTKNENHRTKYGVVIENPENNGNNDEVTLEMPGDQVKANVVIKTTGVSVSAAGGSKSMSINPVVVGMGVLDEDATVGDENLIVVGGPCGNTVAAELLGNPENCVDGFEMGKAKIKAFDSGTKTSILVAGYSAQDTQGACRVLADFEDYALSGDEVEVTVTSLSDLSVATVE
jgi:hypothetical protein